MLIGTSGDERAPFKPAFESLPYEIHNGIINKLLQQDSLNLMRVNRKMYLLVLPRLYQHIIVDSDITHFSKEISYLHSRYDREFRSWYDIACTYINNSYNFMKFLKSYIRLHCNNPAISNAPHIKILTVKKLPESINTYEHEFKYTIRKFFCMITNLQELTWLNRNFRFEFLNCLENPQNLMVLSLNIRFTDYLYELLNYDSNKISQLKFNLTKLTKFEIKPFINSKTLSKILNDLIGGGDHDILGPQLRSLSLSRTETYKGETNIIANELVNNGGTMFPEFDLSVIPTICSSNLRKMPNLTSLSLNDCIIQPQDADELIKAANLRSLRTLKLSNMSEFQTLPITSASISENLLPSFLNQLSSHLTNLKYLRLDFRQAFTDTVPIFLKDLASLESLDLTIRHNNTFDTNYNDYSKGITSWNKTETLKHLSIEIKQETLMFDVDLQMKEASFYNHLAKCQNLETLRIAPDESRLINLLKNGNLPKLNKLDIISANCLGLVNPEIYQALLEFEQKVLVYAQASGDELQYICINGKLFELQSLDKGPVVNPREDISVWFTREVRV